MTEASPGLAAPLLLDLGGRRPDLTRRALVMGILDRTTDSFFDGGATSATTCCAGPSSW